MLAVPPTPLSVSARWVVVAVWSASTSRFPLMADLFDVFLVRATVFRSL